MNTRTIIILAALGGVALYLLKKKVQGATVAGAAQALGGAVVDVADGAITGVVKGTGALFGIPDTDADACERAKALGNTWDASFACSAGDFFGYLWGEPQSSVATGPAVTAYERAQASGSGSIVDADMWGGGTFQGGGKSTDLFGLGIGF